jgi:hypothetical protein
VRHRLPEERFKIRQQVVRMLIQIIHCHPLTDSYNHALCQTIVVALEQNGHHVAITDLYRERFDPVMTPDERRSYYEASYDNAGVSAETALLRRIDGIIFCFPHWWFSMPRHAKGIFRPRVGPRHRLWPRSSPRTHPAAPDSHQVVWCGNNL